MQKKGAQRETSKYLHDEENIYLDCQAHVCVFICLCCRFSSRVFDFQVELIDKLLFSKHSVCCTFFWLQMQIYPIRDIRFYIFHRNKSFVRQTQSMKFRNVQSTLRFSSFFTFPCTYFLHIQYKLVWTFFRSHNSIFWYLEVNAIVANDVGGGVRLSMNAVWFKINRRTHIHTHKKSNTSQKSNVQSLRMNQFASWIEQVIRLRWSWHSASIQSHFSNNGPHSLLLSTLRFKSNFILQFFFFSDKPI